ncbi:MAG: hypothetical protein RLO05_01375, partial [Rhodospirillales bacterium]
VRIYYHRSLPKWHADLSRRQFAVLSRLTGLEFQEADTFDEDRGISVCFAIFGGSQVSNPVIVDVVRSWVTATGM